MNEWLGARNRGIASRLIDERAVQERSAFPGCSIAILATDSIGVTPGIAASRAARHKPVSQ